MVSLPFYTHNEDASWPAENGKRRPNLILISSPRSGPSHRYQSSHTSLGDEALDRWNISGQIRLSISKMRSIVSELQAWLGLDSVIWQGWSHQTSTCCQMRLQGGRNMRSLATNSTSRSFGDSRLSEIVRHPVKRCIAVWAQYKQGWISLRKAGTRGEP